ncbi:DUF3365 domain-containing protein [uncultured Thiocystis sp.]|jgi:hypothetical protein|uniref:Tll0287-like domain-containing protein n=1 Tax=uncultured Thiocystis sp. TaxID=1202134 RepID=UPI0025D11884|nr:DUF3365 domain-containing protein [uncultured Thiocystis sp.]
MKTLVRLTAASAFLTVGLAIAETPAAKAPVNPNVEEAKGIVKAFATQLQGELKAAIDEGGPVQAIGVCKERAPAIAAELGEKTGWQVKRTSLKTRNAELDTPDAWEQDVLTAFEQRKAAGEDVQTMAQATVVETEAGKAFRFMKAIPTGEVCLACHGSTINPEVAAALDEHYPNDQARGYSLGDIRGAFSLTKPL